MLSVYGVLQENDNQEPCIDEIPVIDLIAKYRGKEVSISVTDVAEIDENEGE